MQDDLLDSRLTERRNPDTVEIDTADPVEIVDLINAEDRDVPEAVASQRDQIARAIEIAVECLRAGGRLIYVGAGTSGRLGVLDAAECPPTFGTDPDTVQGVIAGGNIALLRSLEGAEDRAEDAVAAIDDRSVGPNDFIFGIAASSTTPFVQRALEHAVELGARTGFLCCTEPDPQIQEMVDICIVPLVGPEVIAGSTRMKAGTATKLVLNTISTGAMVRLGKVYQNLMVDLQANSAKLKDRGERIIMAVTESPRAKARAAIEEADGSVKTALVMVETGLARVPAEVLLAESSGFVRDALDRAALMADSDDPYAAYPDLPPDDDSRRATVDALRSTPRTLSRIVADHADERLATRPSEDGWSPKEVIEHLIRVDEWARRRVRTIMSEDDPVIPGRDDAAENADVAESGARSANIGMLLRRFTDGRAALVARLDTLEPPAFGRPARHARYGPITLYRLLRHLVTHDGHHMRAIRRDLEG